MNSTRPYLIRAFYEWIVDNECTPHIVVNTEAIGVEVPLEYAESGQIVLNIATMAVQSLQLGDEAIDFQARFSGIVRRIHVPIHAVMAIYARENGRGMVFSEEEQDDHPPSGDGKGGSRGGKNGGGGKKAGGKPPHLSVVR